MRRAAWLAALVVAAGCGPSGIPTQDVAVVTSDVVVGSSVRREAGGVIVRLDGETVRGAVGLLADSTGLVVRVDEDAQVAHRLHVTFRAATPERALAELCRLGELSLERERLGAGTLYRVGAPRTIFTADPWHLLSAVILVALALVADRLLDVFFRRRDRASRRGAARLRQAAPLARVALWLFTAVSGVLMLLNVPPSTAVALGGGGLLLVGFASRDMAANLLAGLAIALDRPLHLHDYIVVGEHAGEVTRIGLRSTRLVTLDDTTITVPNAKLAGESVASANYGQVDALIPVTFYVAHHADVTRVRELVWEGVVTSAYCSWRRPVHVIVSEELWATRVVAHAYVFDVRQQLLFVTDVTHRVKLAFVEAGVPYPRLPGAAHLVEAARS